MQKEWHVLQKKIVNQKAKTEEDFSQSFQVLVSIAASNEAKHYFSLSNKENFPIHQLQP